MCVHVSCMPMLLCLCAIIKHCACVRVFVFYLSGTFIRDYPYLAPIPQQATQREGRGKDDVTDNLANSHLLTPVPVTLICAESKHSRESGQEISVYHYILPVLNHSSQTQP